MAIDLTDRVCVVTGAARGIGAAVVRGFAERGAKAIATDINLPAIETAAANLTWDVTDHKAAEQTVKQIVNQHGRLDAFIANAGYYPLSNWDEITYDSWHKIMDINLHGAWYGVRAAADAMVKQGYGKIVIVSSIQVDAGPTQQIPYTIAKSGLIGMTRCMSRALGGHGVRVNAILPGAVLTEGELELGLDQEQTRENMAKAQCLPDRLLPEGVEPTFAFLCSSESDAITGQAICVDHGLIHW